MSDELTPSEEPSDDGLAPGQPEGAPALSDAPVRDQPTAAGQAPAGGALERDPELPADEAGQPLQDDALFDEEQP